MLCMGKYSFIICMLLQIDRVILKQEIHQYSREEIS